MRFQSILFGALVCVAAQAADAPPASRDAMYGAWTLDRVLTPASTPDGASSAGGNAQAPPASRAHGGGIRGNGAGGSGGFGGGSEGMGGGHGGGHHGGGADSKHEHASAAHDDPSVPHERGLARAFASNVSISVVGQRIRFDDGEHAVELDKDGGNVSGPGVGGTVALVATSADLVVQTLTESGYSLQERYHLAEDGRHLEMHVSLKKPGAEQPREFVRVFDHVDAAGTH